MYNPQLETFIKAADCGSFNKAAEELYISPPAVIKQINLLESSLDLQLFVRTHRGLILTDAGKSLYHDAKYIIGYCHESVNRARNAMQKEEAVIRIGTSPMTPGQFLMDMWSSIHEICPDIKFQLVPLQVLLMIILLKAENVQDCGCPMSQFDVLYLSIMNYLRKTVFPYLIYTAGILC